MLRLLTLLLILSYLIGCQNSTTDSPPTRQETTQFDLQVFYIRHALSCANISHKVANIPGANITDPSLSDCGLYRSLKIGERFSNYLAENNIEIDFRGTSYLIRTKETLAMMLWKDFFFTKENIYQLPYIGELPPSSKENTPDNIATQKDRIEASFPGTENQINTQFTDKINIGTPSYHKFRTLTLPEVAGFLRKKNIKNKYFLTIVTHSVFLFNEIKCSNSGNWPHNNEVFQATYRFKQNSSGEISLISNQEQCLPTLPAPASPSTFSPGDYARCTFSPQPPTLPNPLGVLDSSKKEAYISKLSQSCRDY